MLSRYAVDGTDFDAFIVHPQGDGPHPAVLICHAWSGRKEFEEARARDLAALGYVGVAIDLYGVGRRGHDRPSASALMGELTGDPALLHRRLRAAFEHVRTLEGVDPERVASIGYCFGGLCSLLLARLGLPLRAAISFHGLLKLGAPIEAKVTAPMLVLHGQDDPMVPPADIAAFAIEMKRVDAEWTLHAYPGVMHAFTNPAAADPSFGTVYDADADARSWREMRHFLSEHLTDEMAMNKI